MLAEFLLCLLNVHKFEVRSPDNMERLDPLVLFEKLQNFIQFFLLTDSKGNRNRLDLGKLETYSFEESLNTLKIVAYVQYDLLICHFRWYNLETTRLTDLNQLSHLVISRHWYIFLLGDYS